MDLLAYLVMVPVTALVLMNAKAVLRFNSFASLTKLSALPCLSCGEFHQIPATGQTLLRADLAFEIYVSDRDYGWSFARLFLPFLALSPFRMVDEISEPKRTSSRLACP